MPLLLCGCLNELQVHWVRIADSTFKQVPSPIGLCVCMCVCARTLSALKSFLWSLLISPSENSHQPCNSSLRRRELSEERIDREPSIFLPFSQVRHPRRTQTLCLSPPLLCSPHFFFGLYLLYVYIKQFQIL